MGKPVFKTYTQSELDRQYHQGAWSKKPPAEYEADYRSLSGQAAQALGEPIEFQYGESAVERLDVYRCADENAPIHIHIHGGAWRTLDKRASVYAAPLFCAKGVHFVAVDFALMPDVDMATMVDQVRRSVAWIYRNAEEFGGDRDRIYVSGHSSGAHLAACVAVTDWQSYGVPADILKGCVCCSGGYDLEPVKLSARNDYMHLSDEAVRLYSPNRHLSRLGCPLSLSVGELESDEFVRQSVDLAAAAGLPLHKGADMDHFEISLTLGHENGLLAGLALAQIFGGSDGRG